VISQTRIWAIIPAAGAGTRIQPLAFSKELLPVGSRFDGAVERPRAVSEYLIARMIAAGARKLCFVISPEKPDIMRYYGSGIGKAQCCYVVQQSASGLCDALFCALAFVRAEEPVLVGLPDTVWFPVDGYCTLRDDGLSFLLFPVERPEAFDAVVSDERGRVLEIQVKRRDASTRWIWGGFRLTGEVLAELHALWCRRERRDIYLGTLVNAYLAGGGQASAVKAGESYHDVGTVDGYRRAVALLGEPSRLRDEPRASALTERGPLADRPHEA